MRTTRRTIIVTGAGAGIGAAIATAAVGRGDNVAITDIDIDAAEKLAETLGDKTLALHLDIRDPAEWASVFEVTADRFGTIDVLVNNAGIIHTGNTRSLTLQQHRNMVEVNFLGTLTGVHTALDFMNKQGSGHIVTVCSMTSFLPMNGYATYAGTKHAVRAFHHSVALEERGGPLHFSLVHPPSTRTGMLAQEQADPTSSLAFAEKSVAPEEIADAVLKVIDTRAREIVFPTIGGRLHKIAGVFPGLIHTVMPRVAAKGLKNRDKLQNGRANGPA